MIRNLYTFWTEDNEMSVFRKNNIKELQNRCGVNFLLLTKSEIQNYELPEHKFHEAYQYLSATAKSDYLRSYFMNFYGGGYSDIKFCDFDWNQYFDQLENSDKWAIGYLPVDHTNVAVDPLDPDGKKIQDSWQELIGAGAMICKPRTAFTEEWFLRMTNILDNKLEELRKNPAQHVRDRKDWKGTNSGYPLRWAEIGPETLFKSAYMHKEKIIVGLPRPDLFGKYR